MTSIFDSTFNDSPHITTYRGWVLGDKTVPPARTANWPDEDLVAYCGGEFAKPNH